MQQHQVAPHHGQFRKFGQHVSSGNVKTDFSATETAWKLWELMGRFIRTAGPGKNGATPSKLWIAQIGAMTEQQIRQVCRQCMDRCRAGETWPPDLAEFVALISESGANPFGLTVDAVMEEYRRWRNESWRYDGSGTVVSACAVSHLPRICVQRGLSAR